MCVSADTKTCGSPLYPAPTGGLRLPVGKHIIILTEYKTIVNKKIKKRSTFFTRPSQTTQLTLLLTQIHGSQLGDEHSKGGISRMVSPRSKSEIIW